MQNTAAPPTWASDSWKYNSCSREDHPYLHKYPEPYELDPRNRDYRPHEHAKTPEQRLKDGEGDGIWACHRCSTQHILTLYDGPHPFRKLKCCCGHVACFECYYTNVLRPVPPKEDPTLLEIKEEETQWEMVAEGGVCPACGISCRPRKHVAPKPKVDMKKEQPPCSRRWSFGLVGMSKKNQTTDKLPYRGNAARTARHTTSELPLLNSRERVTSIPTNRSQVLAPTIKAAGSHKALGELICLYCADTTKDRWLRFRIGDRSDYQDAIRLLSFGDE